MNNQPARPQLVSLSVDEFLAALADATPSPGGGSASAMAGAMAAALVAMVAGVTLANQRYSAVHAEMMAIRDQATALRGHLAVLLDQDAASYGSVADAYKLPKDTDEERTLRSTAIQAALREATETPLAIAVASLDVMALASTVAADGNRNAAPDARTAVGLADLALRGAIENVLVNIPSIRDSEYAASARQQAEDLRVRGSAQAAEVIKILDTLA